MKLMFEIELTEERPGLVENMVAVSQAVIGFIKALEKGSGGSARELDMYSAAKERAGWVDEKNVGLVFEAGLHDADRIEVRVGYTDAEFDHGSWNAKFRSESAKRVEYTVATGEVSKAVYLRDTNDLEPVASSEVHDRKVPQD